MSSSPTESQRASQPSGTMPQMGVSVAEGTIVEWRKRPGDWVEADETICDVTTDKVDVEIPSPAAGRLGADPGRGRRRPSRSAPRWPRSTPARRPGEAHPDERSTESADRMRIATRRPPPALSRPTDAASPIAPVLLAGGAADRRQARHRPRQVEGTGIGGRVRKKDVLAHIEADARAVASRSARPPHRVPLPRRRARGARPSRGHGDEAPDGAPVERAVPAAASRCRRCARRSPGTWSASRRTAAHCTTIVEADFSRVAARRRSCASRWRGAASTSPTSRSWPGRRSRRSRSIRCSTRRWTATRSSTTTTSTSGSRSPSTTA